jgi:hypothetical protein
LHRWRDLARRSALVVALSVPLASSSGVANGAAHWKPRPELTWQWQLTVPVDESIDAQVYDIDGFDNSAAVVGRLHARGRKVICYVDAGAWERFRPDAARFPRSVLGKVNPQWPDQRWLDIRRLDVLAPIMRARLDMCRAKGFDGVELDEIDGWQQDTGFRLTAGDQLRYNRFLAREVRSRGMAAGLKNDLDQVRALLPSFDFAVNEQCVQYVECGRLLPFIRARKSVFHVEYHVAATRFCPLVNRLGFSSMRKRLQLDAWRRSCR